MRASSSDFVLVAGNSITGVRKAGIRLSTPPDSVICANAINGPRQEGIRLTSCRDAIVDANLISGGQLDGVALTGSSDDTTLNANTVTGCSRRGVRTTSSSDALVITDNTAADNGDNGFDFRSVGAVVDGNVATGNGGNGFRVGNSLPMTFTQNSATDNDGFGFDVSGLDEADLLSAGNTASATCGATSASRTRSGTQKSPFTALPDDALPAAPSSDTSMPTLRSRRRTCDLAGATEDRAGSSFPVLHTATAMDGLSTRTPRKTLTNNDRLRQIPLRHVIRSLAELHSRSGR